MDYIFINSYDCFRENEVKIFRWKDECPKCSGKLNCSGSGMCTEYSAECSKCKKRFHKANVATPLDKPLDWIEH